MGFAQRTTLVSFRWSTPATHYRRSGWLQMENSGGLCTENDSGALKMLYSEKNGGLFQMENVSGESFAAGE